MRGCVIGTACQVLGSSCKEEEMGSACGMCGEEVKCIQGFDREKLKESSCKTKA